MNASEGRGRRGGDGITELKCDIHTDFLLRCRETFKVSMKNTKEGGAEKI